MAQFLSRREVGDEDNESDASLIRPRPPEPDSGRMIPSSGHSVGVVPDRGELPGDESCGRVLLESQLGATVQRAPPRHCVSCGAISAINGRLAIGAPCGSE